MKALADEKYREWTDKKHTFSKFKTEILTGDIDVTAELKSRLKKSNIIILTPEMFNSKCRSFSTHPWLEDSVFIGDEIHLIGLEGRGDALEVGLIQYFENSPKSRALFLSATLPNVKDFGDWLRHMTGRESKVIISDYRPCKLNIHLEPFAAHKKYAKTEESRLNRVVELIVERQNDPILVFTGSKAFGRKLSSELKRLKIDHRFHNADVDRETKKVKGSNGTEVVHGRKDIEEGFRNGDFNVLIATTTLAWGINSAARYVIQSHTKFGLTPMHPANIIQAIGRAGRTGWSDKGDAIILVPFHEREKEYKRIFSNYMIESTLTDANLLMFHVLSYIYDGTITNAEEFFNWYQKTLASLQGLPLTEEKCNSVLENLRQRSMIVLKEGKYQTTKLGEITAKMYMSPLDVSDWFKNFSKVKRIKTPQESSESEETRDNLSIAQALAGCYSWGLTWKYDDFQNKFIRYQCSNIYITALEKMADEVLEVSRLLNLHPDSNPNIKYVSIFYRLLCGKEISSSLNSYRMGITKDIERVISTLQQCDQYVGKFFHKRNPRKIPGFNWGKDWKNLECRLKYGVKSSLAELVDIPDIGKKRAENLESKGITTQAQVKNPANQDACERAIGKTMYKKIIKHLEEE
jgi:replicative superfamily II helicase